MLFWVKQIKSKTLVKMDLLGFYFSGSTKWKKKPFLTIFVLGL